MYLTPHLSVEVCKNRITGEEREIWPFHEAVKTVNIRHYEHLRIASATYDLPKTENKYHFFVLDPEFLGNFMNKKDGNSSLRKSSLLRQRLAGNIRP